MKDKQIAASSVEPRIFFVSAFLHCVSMTALVYLRSSFGFGYLRPRSIFFALTWAFVLYTVYAWTDGTAWHQHRALLLFGGGATLLYWTHYLIAFAREWNEAGEHDHYSGTSGVVWLLRRGGQSPSHRFEAVVHQWAEPVALLLVAAVLRLIFGEQSLSLWFLVVAACLWAKEFLNHWFRVRQRKRQKDIFADTEDTVEPPTTSSVADEAPKATRKAKIKRSRNAVIADPEYGKEQRMAEILRLMPPYDLTSAERNYHALIKADHPDVNNGSAESAVRSTDLNEAIEFFRNRSHI